MQRTPAPAVTYLRTGGLQQLADLLQQPCSTAHPLIVDLRGRALSGQLPQTSAHTQAAQGDDGTDRAELRLSRPGVVIRNGVLHLPASASVVVAAPGCRLEGVTVRGRGISSCHRLRPSELEKSLKRKRGQPQELPRSL